MRDPLPIDLSLQEDAWDVQAGQDQGGLAVVDPFVSPEEALGDDSA